MDAILRHEVLIEADQLKSKMAQGSLRIFDATVLMNQAEAEPTAQDNYQQGHIPGAVFLDHSQLSDPNSQYQLTVPGEAELAEAIGAIGIGNDDDVVVYSTGMIAWATRIWWLLRHAGHQNVWVLNGGLKAWQDRGGEMETENNQYEKSQFSADLQSDYFVNKEGMQQALTETSVQTVHSLPQPIFDQAHIPSSVCQPCTDFLQDGVSLLPDEELKQRLVANNEVGKTITYCGGGVAATVNAIVCRLVGNPDVSVYDGSMSEWVGEGLPVESNS